MDKAEVQGLASWAWLSLEERRAALGGCVPPIRGRRAAGRRAYWKRLAGFDDTTFARRIAHADLSAHAFDTLIAPEPPVGVTLRTLRSATACIPTLLDAFGIARRGDEATCELLREVGGADLPFLSSVAPLLAAGLHAMLARGIPERLHRPAIAHLAQLLHRLAERTLVLKLNLARIEGRLTGKSSEERFAHFVRDSLLLEDCVRSHPVLGRVLAESVDRFVDALDELVGRVTRDRVALVDMSLVPADSGELCDLRFGLSDPHGGNRGVAFVRFESGAVLVYKPRPLASETGFQRVLAAVNARGFSCPLRLLAMLDRGDYGYMEYVRPSPCADRAAVSRFFYRQGGYLALFYALHGVDVHSENVIAAGEQPVVVDVECLFYSLPRVAGIADAPAYAPHRLACRSVLASALLPTFFADAQGAVEIGGLGGRPGQMNPHPSLVARDPARDTMHLDMERLPWKPNTNLPLLEDRTAEPLQYVDSIVAGFEEMHALIERDAAAWVAPGGLLDGFREVPVRHLVRATWTYTAMCRDAMHPDFLLSGADRDLAFERLWPQAQAVPALGRLLSSERHDLWRNDVPVFRNRPGGFEVRDGDGRAIHGVLANDGISEARATLCAWDAADRARQVSFIRSSMATLEQNLKAATGRAGSAHMGPRQSPPRIRGGERCASAGELVDAACLLGETLLALALRCDGAASWLVAVPMNDRDWYFGPTGTDLYTGSSGIALFFAALHLATGDARFATAAREATAATERKLLSGDQSGSIGAFTGLASELYALLRVDALLGAGYRIDAVRAGVKTLGASAAGDEVLDLLGGAAGGALVAIRALGLTGIEKAREAAEHCGARLLQVFAPAGAAQLPPAGRELLTGLSHGASGIAWAAAELYALGGDERHAALARALWAWEDGHFIAGIGNWRDLRLHSGSGAAAGAETLETIAWCHGAPGIALGRLLAAPHLHGGAIAPGLDAALMCTRDWGWQPNHSLCHGALGNADVLLTAGLALGRPELVDAAQCWAALVLREIKDTGRARCGLPMPIETASLMDGLAGIGYMLLRFADPGRFPSVLALETEAPHEPLRRHSHGRRAHQGQS